jgi:hypothetical protein
VIRTSTGGIRRKLRQLTGWKNQTHKSWGQSWSVGPNLVDDNNNDNDETQAKVNYKYFCTLQCDAMCVLLFGDDKPVTRMWLPECACHNAIRRHHISRRHYDSKSGVCHCA